MRSVARNQAISSVSRPTGERSPVRWPALAAAAWVGCALFLTLVPSRPRWLFPDLTETVGHILLGLLLGGSLSCLVRALKRSRSFWFRPALASMMVSIIFLAGTELLQGLTATRSPQLIDLLADAVGTAAVIMALAFAFRAGPPLADRASNAFVAAALASALVVVVTAIASPYEPPRTTWPVTGRVACVPAYSGETVPIAEPATDAPPEPLALFDLAVDPTRSSRGTLTPIQLAAVGNPTVRPGFGLQLDGSDEALRAVASPGDLVRSISAAQAFTVEAWIRPADLDQEGPSRIVSLSTGTGRSDVDLHLGLDRSQLSLRMRTACGQLWFLAGQLHERAAHLAATFDHGRLAVFVDGSRVATADLEDADLSSWDPSYDLVIGNETTLDRGYRGAVASIAFYREALSAGQIARLADAPARRSLLDGG